MLKYVLLFTIFYSANVVYYFKFIFYTFEKRYKLTTQINFQFGKHSMCI